MAAVSSKPPHEPGRGFLNLHISRLLLCSLVAALLSTIAVVVVWAAKEHAPRPGPPPPQGGPPPGPPPGTATDLLVIAVALFVICWVAVLVAVCRDQVLRRLAQVPDLDTVDAATQAAVAPLLASLRDDLSQDRRKELAEAEQRLTQVARDLGEQRETDGFLHGMRVGAGKEPPSGRDPSPGGGSRTLHSVPPPASG